MELELVQQAQANNEQAFLELIQRVETDLYKTAYSFLHTEHEALEAVQEVTVRIYQQLPKLRQPAYAKTWMIRIMINYCQDQLKRRKPLLPLFNRTEPGSTQTKEFSFFDLLQSLPKDRQRLLIYRYYLQASIEEIAAVESIPEGTVKSRIHIALGHLRKHFDKKGVDRDVFERQLDVKSTGRVERD